jgi:hypothetical protein
VLPLLDMAGAKLSQLEEVIGGRLEEEGHALAEEAARAVVLPQLGPLGFLGASGAGP